MDAAAGGILKSQPSAPLGVSAWLEAALVGVLIMPVLGAEKWWRRGAVGKDGAGGALD